MKRWQPYLTCCLIALLAAVASVHAQQRYQRWGGGVDDETLHFGFSFHYINADYKFDLKENWQDLGYTHVTSPFSHNVGLGLLADAKLTENINLRLQPNLRFMNIYLNINDEAHKVQRSDIGIPLLLKFKSDRKGNMRGYLIGGGELAFNVSSAKRYDRNVDIMTNRSYLAYTAGIGFDIYFDYFKMSPEIRWVQSVGNMLDDGDGNTFNHNSPIQRLYMRSFQVSLYFE
ncbi:type IX secretion/gliding motility protein PorT/SprT [Parapedobacter sp.]